MGSFWKVACTSPGGQKIVDAGLSTLGAWFGLEDAVPETRTESLQRYCFRIPALPQAHDRFASNAERGPLTRYVHYLLST